MSDKVPEFLYKYLPYDDGAKCVISQNTLKFTCPTNFNDPFDCQIPLDFDTDLDTVRYFFVRNPKYLAKKPLSPMQKFKEATKMAHEYFKSDGITQAVFLENVIHTKGVLSLSEVNNDILMWSHYADHHRGFCVGFRCWQSDDHYFRSARKVNYQTELPNISFFKCCKIKEFTDTVFLTKSIHWKYEEESRLLNTPNIHSYPKELLKIVIFGVNMQPDARQEIIKLLVGNGLKPKLYEAKLSKIQYGLDIVDYYA